MFDPIFKDNAQGQKHPGSSVVAEPKLHCFRTHNSVSQNE